MPPSSIASSPSPPQQPLFNGSTTTRRTAADDRQQSSSFRQVACRTQTAAISMVTAEGDVVSLSVGQGISQTSAAQFATTADGRQTMSGRATSQAAQAMALTVQGDLSDEELADVRNLINDLTAIATDFFNGDLQAATSGALNLGDMGSVSSLSASFRTSATVSTSLSQSMGPASLAAAAAELDKQFTDRFDQSKADHYAAMVKAQWQQLNEMFTNALTAPTEEQAAGTNPPASPPTGKETTAAQQLLSRLKRALASHPRLAPLSEPLVDKAVDQAADSASSPLNRSRVEQLKNDFRRLRNQWLLSA